MRPIGSWLFGRIADRHGRKRSMVASIYLMGFSSFLFAALPTYEQVGMFAPLLLLLVRLLQGLSVGGEYGAVATYMSELGLKGQRGFFCFIPICHIIRRAVISKLAQCYFISVSH